MTQTTAQVITARTLEKKLRNVLPAFCQAFNDQQTPAQLKTLLNEITPALIAFCFQLEVYADKTERN